jgi:hypothetical protein
MLADAILFPMAAAAPEVQTSAELQAKLAEILVSWPLYRVWAYVGKDCHHVGVQSGRYGVLPKQLRMFCNNCKHETVWENQQVRVSFGYSFFNEEVYLCRNCGKETTRYVVIWQENESSNIFLKVGQYPELEERVSETLVQALSTADLKLYKNALRMRNFNLGVAAVAYMRRVVENRMNDILEILHEAALAHKLPAEALVHHKEMMEEKRFAVKVDYAGTLLPSSLRPTGKPNPMSILHELASDGLHAKSDEECVDIFDACRRTFEYVFGKLRIETEDAKNFVKEMANLTEKRTKIIKNDAAGKQGD